MAGVGFSLRAMGLRGLFLGRARGLISAGVISSGPGLCATLGLFAIGSAGRSDPGDAGDPALLQFRVAVTWLLAASLIWTAPLQLTFTRFAADCEYVGDRRAILPNLWGALACASAGSALLAALLSLGFSRELLGVKLLLGTAFVAASDAWLIAIALASQREHRAVLACFAFAYGVAGAASRLAGRVDLEVLLAAFAFGQASFVFGGLAVVGRTLPRPAEAAAVSFAFVRRCVPLFELALAGLAFQLGCWADELVFWSDPQTSRAVFGPLRASDIYDLPSVAASACLIPGMAVFLVHVETELAERQRAYFDAVLAGAPLLRLHRLAELLSDAARSGITAILRTQALTWCACLAFGPSLLRWLVSDRERAAVELHLPLFHVAALTAALQMIVIAALSMLFYLDRRRAAFALSVLLCGSNAGFSWLTLQLGPAWYGFGAAVAMGVTCVAALSLLNRAFDHLVRDTFVLQPGAPQ